MTGLTLNGTEWKFPFTCCYENTEVVKYPEQIEILPACKNNDASRSNNDKNW